MTTPERTSTVINAGLVLYGQSEFGPEPSPIAFLRGGKANFDDEGDPLLSPESQQPVIEVVRRAVRRAGRR
jgi:hypothetical protein